MRPAFVEVPLTATRTSPVCGLAMVKVESPATSAETFVSASEVSASTTWRNTLSPKKTFC